VRSAASIPGGRQAQSSAPVARTVDQRTVVPLRGDGWEVGRFNSPAQGAVVVAHVGNDGLEFLKPRAARALAAALVATADAIEQGR
jgi:hypothetical protein